MFSLESYQAVQAGGGVVRRADRGVLSVAGADRASWLQGLLTNDVAALADGERRYAAYLTPQGRMISDMNVIARGDRMLLDVPRPLAQPLRDRLDGLIFSEDVSVADLSDTWAVWTIIRPEDFLTIIDETLPSEYQALPAIDMDTFEVIRIERGEPRFLADMTEDTIPLEAGIEDRAISFTKGCYVGQEIIVRVTHRGGGRVARKLVQWVGDEGAAVVPMPESKIYAFDKEIGRVTSSAFSPRFGRVVGLGYVHRDFTSSGTSVTIVWKDTRVKASVK
ncbi:MAG TPA: glycine cleavage T C-terminal barrel domain-containing protein [Vicinamibacterales bacterium]|nr:glycine cleavage T C-terminal barrel domain-containing protein [Vicinamibacterales bacterium]